MATPTLHAALETVQSNIEEIRNLASCKICLRPFYEPFMLNCGHTFCYGCLRNWVCGGENRRKKRNCPDCRASITRQPAPNYTLRDLAHMFTDRAELLSPDETLEDHSQAKQEEARLLAEDRKGVGLFRNIFPNPVTSGQFPRAFYDSLDGVLRCPECNWEMEDGMCNQCGFDPGADSFDEDESVEGETLSEASILSLEHPGATIYNGGYSDGEPELYNPYYDSDRSDTTTEINPLPWGARAHHRLHLDIDEPDEEDWASEDDEDDMEDFIDDGRVEVGNIQRRQRHGPNAIADEDGVGLYPPVIFGESDYDPSEGGSPVEDLSHGGSTHNLSNTDNDYADGSFSSLDETSDADEEEGSDEAVTATVTSHRPIKRQTHIILSDEEDEDEDQEHDHFEDAVTAQEGPKRIQRTAGADSEADSTYRPVDYGDGLEEEDEEDDEPISSVRRTRSRSQGQTTWAQQQVERSRQRSSRDRGAVQRAHHGYHPYARDGNIRRDPQDRYRNSSSNSRSGSRATYVF